MSLTEISVRVAIVTVLALAALIGIGWRRSAPQYPRGARPSTAGSADPNHSSHDSSSSDDRSDIDRVGRLTTRKFFDVLGLGSIASFIAIMVALVTSTAIAWLVTSLLNRL